MNKPPLILLVDDRPDNLALLEAILEPEGFQLQTAESGEEAMCSISSSLPDLLLLDVMMPDMDGFEVCRQLRARPDSRFVPVIMITALTEVDDRIKGLEAGADDFISKPINDNLLLAKIRSLLNLKKFRDDLDQMKTDFNNMIVHDLRAPLHSILGLIELLREDLPVEGNHLRLLELMERSGEKINHLISDFLDLAQWESGRLKLSIRETDLVELIRLVAHNFEPIARRKNITIHFETNHEEARATVDPDRIDQVLSNLLQNAVKFSPRNSNVRISLISEDSFLACTISDEGPGLPEQELENVFEKYFQTEVLEGGIGLGLYVSRAIIEAHGGTIEAANNPAGGARFRFRIPKKQEM